MVKKIIPCLDVKDGRVVKGVNFVNLRDAGDPVELAELYVQEGADELVFLDISATEEGRATMADVVAQVAAKVTIPFAVGGGISSLEDIERLLQAGANKVGINSAAVSHPELINEVSRKFGSKTIVAAIDAKYNDEWQDWEVYTSGGKKATGLHAVAWAKEVEQRGAGEILLTSMDADGTKDGFDIALTKAVSEAVAIPVTASGGAGNEEDFYEVLTKGKAAAGLAATIFHYKELAIPSLKSFLKNKGVEIRA